MLLLVAWLTVQICPGVWRVSEGNWSKRSSFTVYIVAESFIFMGLNSYTHKAVLQRRTSHTLQKIFSSLCLKLLCIFFSFPFSLFKSDSKWNYHNIFSCAFLWCNYFDIWFTLYQSALTWNWWFWTKLPMFTRLVQSVVNQPVEWKHIAP